MSSLKEKIGYGFGDMSSSMFWKIFSYYLPFFYSNIFGLSLVDAGVLVLVTRIWDAVSDPMMGIISDRTNTKWGKYRPYLLWVAPFFSICGILLFTTPDLNYGGKLIWAYVTYILMMTVYTGINVPYGAMLGVMTDDSNEKTVFSSFRMFFAYGGSFISLFLWEPLTNLLGGYNTPGGWFWAMAVIAAACFVMFILCFLMTKEHLKTVSTVSVGNDFKALLTNKPWWLLIGAALCFNLFNTVRGATVAYFFQDIIGPNVSLVFFGLMFVFYAGLFLGVGEVSNMVGVASCVPIASKLGKKTTFILVNGSLVVLSILFFFIPCTPTGYWMMLISQILISILTGIMSPLVWSMYADVSDYAELKFSTASTGLIFSSSSMAQKFGGAIGGAAVLWLLSGFGYITDPEVLAQGPVAQPESALTCLRWLMSFVPACVALLSVCVVWFYPLTTERIKEINKELRKVRAVTD
ncbi:glycoside/pentoside/hexuronide:cation symporter, GPH family [Prevotella sp. tc2-28]|uniref:MFS transporter n=1 Tax=Prevotella sp. tc2-28 TaxID=1761888 RepID=UPI00089D4BB9|nr:MFS transporter [Prevotella sp. tc2-28]SDZ88907.1 glycoside/pentoside/hexuronide:cation symporter, GPH family [Prevotella sp. tc2-28]